MAARWLGYFGLIAAAAVAAGVFTTLSIAPEKVVSGVIDPSTTGVIAPATPVQDRQPRLQPIKPDHLEDLRRGLAALRFKRSTEALSIRDGLPANSLDRHVLSWAIALYGGDGIASAEIARTARELSRWPGAEDLHRRLERSLMAQSAPPEVVRELLDGRTPITPEGAIALARSRLADGDRAGVHDALAAMWRSEKMDPQVETIILNEFSDILTVVDHRVRMERMLYSEDVPAARRVAPLAHSEPLFDAWSAVLDNARSSRALLDAVPGELRSPGYSFARIKGLRKSGRLAEAADLMMKAPTVADVLVDPHAWWIERRLLARNLYESGKIRLAYRLVSNHAAETPTDRADAEFTAGWYALRGLKDPSTAERHFARINAFAEGAISRARAYYWLGRAAEDAGDPASMQHYAAAAGFGTTFYGQLAAARIGRPALNLPSPEPTEQDRRRFAAREEAKAIDRLISAGQPQYASRLYLALARQMESAGEIALLAGMAENSGNHFIALKVAKAAAQRGLDVGSLSHPLGVIPDDADIAGAGKALAYAIARQESEFNVGAVSGAGALGLLQLMPGTAQETANKIGLAYSPQRLTIDPAYNATLGAAMLNEQLGRFDGSYILTFAAYNAGPRRVAPWIARYGDPRGQPVDKVIDWIESIPFTETRAYVQRVMENYEVYKMRLYGRFDIVSDLTKGRMEPMPAN
ncbi:MAG: lytic transglycosylase domain-containing protein [Rhizobiaceae bacterium]|nr:lytic transglycosylase domain-containing protein [Rhizobiaceae bacterium]